ncbi:MAG: ribosome maturation factor RimM [Treponema sp.]|jgi:16S rRNA processing protein RimM|nr:ribosome maturation factor RimM [Treponema sp.]
MTNHFVSALIGSPFGLSGRVKIKSLSGEIKHLLKLQKVVLRISGKEKEYAIEEIFTTPLSVKFSEIDSPEAAKTLKGAEILVPRHLSASLGEGEFYIEDLRRLIVFVEGKPVGTIDDIIEGGGGFLVEILLSSGEKRLVPFRNEFFGPIDLAFGRLELLKSWILE